MDKKLYNKDMAVKIGTTFSYLEVEYLGLNWKKALEKILNLGLSPIRIGSYWSKIEKKRDFPHWLEEKLNLHRRQTIEGSTIKNYLLPFLKKTVNHCQNHQVITHFQVENEPLGQMCKRRK